MFVSNASRPSLHGALPPVHVTPEGTARASASCSSSSVSSLIPLKRRIPQAPVFIARAAPPPAAAPPASSFISDACSSSPPKTYYFDDDYASIGASESTAPPDAARASASRPPRPYPRRPSVTGAIRRRISLARRLDERTLSHKLRRASRERDSVMEDWKRSRQRPHTSSCAPFALRGWFGRQRAPLAPHAPVVQLARQQQQQQQQQPPAPQQQQQQPAAQQWLPSQRDMAHGGALHDDFQLVSALAYEDFMHGRKRAPKSARVLARLRRA